MLARWLGVEGGIHYPELGLRADVPGWAVFVMIAAVFGAACWMYRRESALDRRRQWLLGCLRGALLSLLLLLFFGPVFRYETDTVVKRNLGVALDISGSMALTDPRTELGDIARAAVALGRVPFPAAGQTPDVRDAYLTTQARGLPPDARTAAVGARRLDLVRSAFGDGRLDLARRLDEVARVQYFTLGDTLAPVGAPTDSSGLPGAWADAAAPDAKLADTTALGTLLDEAAAALSGGTAAGIVFVTDGASNRGRDPREVAQALAERGIALYPVGVGVPEPPDVRVVTANAPEAAFLDDKVAVLAHLSSVGYEGRPATLVVDLGGREQARRDVILRGGSQFEEITFVARAGGATRLNVRVLPLAGEATEDNNEHGRPIQIIDQKIRVLYMEGMPRWEFRYLRQILLRDHRLDVKFCMTEGDPVLPTIQPLETNPYISAFPSTVGEADQFDLVIIGDVAPDRFTTEQFARVRELVEQRGGSLLMIAGPRHAPMGYAGTPVEALLPVNLGQGAWTGAPRGAYPVLTADGRRDILARLEYPDAENERLWSVVAPIDRLPPLAGAKSGATTLLTLSDPGNFPAEYPLMAWQRFGKGRTMFTALDQLWRLRYKRGDTYHARFWRQTIKFLSLSRLLGDNARVTIDVPTADYRAGERIPVYVNALTPSYEPMIQPEFMVQFAPDGAGTAGSPVTALLSAVASMPGSYEGHIVVPDAGRYVVVTPEVREEPSADGSPPKPAFNHVVVDVNDIPLERAEPALMANTLRQMAAVTGGRYFTLADLADLPATVEGERRTLAVRRSIRLDEHWLWFALLVALAGVEWALRRKHQLV